MRIRRYKGIIYAFLVVFILIIVFQSFRGVIVNSQASYSMFWSSGINFGLSGTGSILAFYADWRTNEIVYGEDGLNFTEGFRMGVFPDNDIVNWGISLKDTMIVELKELSVSKMELMATPGQILLYQFMEPSSVSGVTSWSYSGGVIDLEAIGSQNVIILWGDDTQFPGRVMNLMVFLAGVFMLFFPLGLIGYKRSDVSAGEVVIYLFLSLIGFGLVVGGGTP